MPKVKYLKDLCSGSAGTVHDLQDYEANVLIQLRAAELIDDDNTTKADAGTETEIKSDAGTEAKGLKKSK